MELTAILAILSPFCSIAFAYFAFARNKHKGAAEDGQQSGTVLTEIGYIKSGIDDIKRKQEKADAQHIEVMTRLAKVEASTTQAHKRLDNHISQEK